MHNFRIKFSKRLTLVFCLGLFVAFLLAGCATQNADRETGVPGLDPSQSMEITSIGLSEEPDSINVVINGIEPLTYTSVKQPLPLGVVLYFPNTRLNVSQTDVPSTGNPVTSIHAGQIEAKTNTTRIEILLAADVPYNVVQDGNSLKIQFPKNISGVNQRQQRIDNGIRRCPATGDDRRSTSRSGCSLYPRRAIRRISRHGRQDRQRKPGMGESYRFSWRKRWTINTVYRNDIPHRLRYPKSI